MVYVISPAGTVVRIVKVQLPFEKAVPIALMIDAGRLAIESSDPSAEDTSDTTIRVADALTGEKIADCRIAPELTEAVACYTDNRCKFLGNSNEWPAIMQVNTY
jgi:predicted amidohydrolase YtcJ